MEAQLGQLRAAAATGPFTGVHFNQVASILNQDKCDLKHCTAALHTITLSLQSHPPADPSAPPPGFLPSNLLTAIFSLCQRHPKPPPIPGPTLSLTLFTDAAFAMLDALLQGPISLVLHIQQRGGTAAESASQIQAWRPLWQQLKDLEHNPAKSQLCQWMKEASAALPDARFEATYRKEWAAIRADMLHEDTRQPASSSSSGCQPPLPGTQTILAMGAVAILGQICNSQQKLLDADRPTWRSRDPAKSPNPKTDRFEELMVTKFMAAIEQDAAAFPLPHGVWPHKVADFVKLMTADFCNVLLDSSTALRNLARPLVALAEDVSLWQTGIHTHHVQLLDDLCRWIGSVHGTAAVQKLARQLVQPVTAVLDTLLEQLCPEDRKGAAYLVQTTIRVMTHLAATDYGRTHMASSGCLPRWLELAPRWRRQPGVLQRLLLLASMAVVPLADRRHAMWVGRLLKYLMYEGGKQGLRGLPEFTCGACPNLLHLQVASSRSIEALTTLMEGDLDLISWSVALRLALDIEHHHEAALKPLLPALLAFSKPRTPPLAYPADPGIDLERYLMHSAAQGSQTFFSASSHEADQLSALGIASRLGGQAGATAVASTSRTLRSHLAEWLEVLQQGKRAETAGGIACGDVARTLCSLIGLGLCSPHQMSTFTMDHNALPQLASLLPHVARLGPDDNGVVSTAMAANFEILQITAWAADADTPPWQHIRGCSYTAELPARLAKRANLEAVLRHLQQWAFQLGFSSGGLPNLAMLKQCAAMQVLSMLSAAACCWGPSGEEGQACRMVLEADVGVWGLFMLGLGVAPDDVHFIDPCLHFLHQQLQREKQPELQRLAKQVLVEELDEKVVAKALKHTKLRLPWKQYAADFNGVFAEAASSKARPAAQVRRGSAAGGNAAPGQRTTQGSTKPRSSSGLGGKAASSSASQGGGTAGSAAGTSSAAAGGSASISGGAAEACMGDGTGARDCCRCHATPEATFLCGRCQAVRYCSKECQKADWKQHKRVCKQQL